MIIRRVKIKMPDWILHRERNNNSEMQNNALCVFSYLYNAGWSLNAIAGILGNMQAESSIQPMAVQGYLTSETPPTVGYGLIQWTNSKASSVNENPLWIYTNGDWYNPNKQLEFINGADASGWIARTGYKISYSQFKTSAESPEYLASAYLRNRERPQNYSTENARRSQARYWYNYLYPYASGGEIPPSPPDPGDIPDPDPDPDPEAGTAANILIWLLFRKRRGVIKWT